VRKEGLINRLVKGLWALTGKRSSEFIGIAKEISDKQGYSVTGSRLRGVMSSPTHKNYRVATEEDLKITLFVVLYLSDADCKFHSKRPPFQ